MIMKKIMFVCAILLYVTTLSAQSAAGKKETPPVPDGLKYIGKIKPRPASAIASSMLWIGGEVLDRDYAVYDHYKKYLGPLGAKKIRLQSGWAKTEKVKGVYDFNWMDNVVDDALRQGVQPWIQISYGNPIYPGAGGIGLGEGLITSEEGFTAWEKYVAALVDRYKDRVKEWEIWNEADLKTNGVSQGDYLKLFMRTAPVVRKSQPDAFIVGLALAHVNETKLVTDFLDYLKSTHQLNLVNAITIHGYPENPDATLKSLLQYKDLVKTYAPGLQVWQGESGCPSSYGSSGALGKYPWTETSQAKWDIRRALMHIGNQVPFSLFTMSEYTYNSTRQKGLNTKGILKVKDDLTIAYAKPVYRAYQNLTSTFDATLIPINYEVINITDSIKYTIATFQHNKTRKVVKAVWLSSAIPQDTDQYQTVTLKFNKGDFSEQPVYANVLNSDVYSISQKHIKNVNGTTAVTVQIYDAPVLIGDRSVIYLK